MENLLPKFDVRVETDTDKDEHSENEEEEEEVNVDQTLNAFFPDLDSTFLVDYSDDLVLSMEKKIEEHCKKVDLKKEIPEDASLRYVVGFVLNKQFKTHVKCEKCPITLSTTDKLYNSKSELLIKYKGVNFEKYTIYNPRDDFFYVCKLQYKIFSKCMKEMFHIKNVKNIVKDICIKETKKAFPNFYIQDNCLEHKYVMLDYLLKILFKRNCKWIVDEKIKKQKHLAVHRKNQN